MQRSLLVAAVLWGIVGATHADETIDCSKVSSIIKTYGNGAVLTVDQATRYFMDKPKSTISVDVLTKALRSGPITTEKLTELQKEDARRSANSLVQQYGNGKFITEQDLQNYFLQTDPTFKKSCQPDFLTRVFQDRLHVRNSALEVKGQQLPAQFSWTHASDSGNSFQIDAAVSYDLATWKLNPNWSLYAKPAVEAHTSTLTTASRDSISAKVPMEFVYGASEKAFTDP